MIKKGDVYGRLTAIRPTDKRKHGKTVWECVCECGNTHYATTSHLSSGSVRSCGCLGLESRKRNLDIARKEIEINDSVNGTRISMLDAKLSKGNSSGHKGVRFNKNYQKFEAYIHLKGNKKYLGIYDKIEDAIEARKIGEEIYFKPMLEKYKDK
ncbi:hypothetical protein [Jeotgalibaca porci]|uniref:hypothetical protein n=1 Tax=Jeotgalibaca porci TaxID=1868793 RepID=UPI0035A14240